MKSRVNILIALGLLAVLILSGCSSQGSNASESKKDSDLDGVTIKVAQTGWGSYEEALKAAELDDTPYKVEYSVFQGGNLILEAMTAGHVDFGETSEIPPIFSALSQKGENSKVIATQQSNTLQQELVVPKGSKIKKVEDLKGKKVAYVNNTTSHYFLIKMLEDAGLSWEDIKPVQLTTSDGLTALVGGKVDALASYGNAILSAHENDAVTVASAKDILSGNFQLNASTAAIEDPKKHKAIVDYISRINKAYEWQRQHKEEWAKIVAANTKQPVKQALQTLEEGEAQKPTKIIPNSEVTVDSQQDIIETFKDVGIIEKSLDAKTFWSDKFDKELAKVLKK